MEAVRQFHEFYDTDDSTPSPQHSGRLKKTLTINTIVMDFDNSPTFTPGKKEPLSGILKNPKKADHEIKFRIREIINYYFMHPD
jgi:hypothetical protein